MMTTLSGGTNDGGVASPGGDGVDETLEGNMVVIVRMVQLASAGDGGRHG